MKKLPNFFQLESNYPIGAPEAVKRNIGGKVNYGWIKNTCAIRMSKALNYSGHPIPKRFGGLNTITGGDKKNYAFRVRELRKYLERTYGKADIIHKNKGRTSIIPRAFKNKKGIILFEVDGWSDATGHFTLWDGNKCIDGTNYWGKSKKILLWVTNKMSN